MGCSNSKKSSETKKYIAIRRDKQRCPTVFQQPFAWKFAGCRSNSKHPCRKIGFNVPVWATVHWGQLNHKQEPSCWNLAGPHSQLDQLDAPLVTEEGHAC